LILLPLSLVTAVGAMAGQMLWPLLGSPRYFLVTTDRVLVFRNGAFKKEAGGVRPEGDGEDDLHPRLFWTGPAAGTSFFSESAIHTGSRSVIYIKGADERRER